ncbi:MAG: RnfABCDGE type electron transport complex subunit B [Candidatus Sumerlaeota bacterium]
MSLSVILTPIGLLALLGFVVGLVLLVASKKFAVEENPLVEEINEVLPGTNCGACGYAGCRSLAEAFARDPELDAYCPVGGDAVAQQIAEILGIERKAAEKKIARLMCGGTVDCASRVGVYEGIEDCAAVEIVSGSPKECEWGCVGMGNCVRACPFDAIEYEDGVIKIIEEKCVGCGVCAKICPRNCIELMGSNQRIYVACHSKDKGAQVRRICTVGCIGCKKCEKNCPTGAIKVENFYAHISPELCSQCGECARQCPTNCIMVLDAEDAERDASGEEDRQERVAVAANTDKEDI